MSNVSADRALLVGVEFAARVQPIPRSAALARQAARLSDPQFSDTSPDWLDSYTEKHSETTSLLLSTPGTVSIPGAERPGAQEPIWRRPNSADRSDSESAFAEFRELVRSAGAEIAAEIFQRRPRADPATLVGRGKVEEIAAVAESSGASLILFDHDLTPTQLRNLEDALPVRVVDRTQLILDIFARQARTREGKLQVELAQLEYMLPRLTGRGKAMSQLGGGIGTRGPGETQLETDRRRIQRRLLHLRHQLEAVRRVRAQQRFRRESVPVPTIALVGYTNAGKSTLFNLLTRSDVLASPRMFATLDPKLRAMMLPSRRKILLSDTVGFIRDLPHTLITSFRATLEEVEKAEILLHVQDCSSPLRERRAEEVEKVLGELGVLDKPRIAVWNKIDLLTLAEVDAIAGRGISVSSLTGEGIAQLLEEMDRALTADRIVEQDFIVPQTEGSVLASLEAGALIQKREFSGESVHLAVAGPISLLGRFQRYRQPAETASRQLPNSK